MNNRTKAIVVGVGPEAGLGGALCKRLAQEGLHVSVVGRSAPGLETLVASIRGTGGCATAVSADATSEKDVIRVFDHTESDGEGALDLVVYNAGNASMGLLHEMEASAFEAAWRVGCFGGFLVGREAIRRMLRRNAGTVIFTGATASLRGKPHTTGFAAAKAGLRSLAQSMARAYGPQGIHVAHVIIDGGIAGEKILTNAPQFAQAVGDDGLISLTGLADAYWYLYTQPKTAWTHELDLRTFKESF